ncbi:Protein-L-isoaspartateD-aspartate O-methyltransferase [Hondaea fermentalgiana]|uniref:protein-L-isoaspartate(D-aspartate) O-methyltransferase n=1 Tax=Hondaea fermentalgiana TaxID=2315210 RepID=A0A2R5GR84_9STRA|nr:Protein-L-isoaspartateD-aspartate O-methyltransferase [Hondaea fermentalgiana]|eukprot:GBG33360.1 Protein-L-isoaspartateD-aspartate O-methyltransferase [Hondaea fermentalgiana]
MRLAEAFSKVNRGRFFEKKHTNLVADEGAFAAEGPAPAAPNDGKVLPLDCAVDHVQQSELLLPWLKPGNVVLDCGCGSGYLAAVYAVMVAGKAETGGKVVGVDRRGSLADTAIPRVGETCKELLGAGLVDDSVLKRIIVMPLDGVGDLPLPGGPFDAIRVGFGFPQDQDAEEGDGCEELSRLLDQLRPGGRLVAHMGPKATGPTIFDKAADGTVTRVKSSVASVHVPAPFERRVAVEGEDPESDAQAQAAEDKRLARRSALQDELRAWREEFERSQGRRPTRHDMVADAKAAALFQEFNKLNTGDLSKL